MYNSLLHIHKNFSNNWRYLSVLLENHLGLCFLWGEDIHEAGARDLSSGCLTPNSREAWREKAPDLGSDNLGSNLDFLISIYKFK